jgi:hypothetical protein
MRMLIKELAPAVLEHPGARITRRSLMTTTTIAQPAHPSTRELRGLALYEEHGTEIWFEDGVWLVPSQHDATSVYEVTLGRRGEFCECADFEFRGGRCLHIYAATIAWAKTAPCSGCSERFRHRDLVEVQESLTYFEGDLLCHGCWQGSDAEVL